MSLPSGVWFPWWLSGKESAYNTGDAGSILGSRSPGEGDGNPLQYSCLGNPMNRGAWRSSPWSRWRVRQDLATEQQQSHPGHWGTTLASSFTPSSFDSLPFRFLHLREGAQREMRNYVSYLPKAFYTVSWGITAFPRWERMRKSLDSCGIGIKEWVRVCNGARLRHGREEECGLKLTRGPALRGETVTQNTWSKRPSLNSCDKTTLFIAFKVL